MAAAGLDQDSVTHGLIYVMSVAYRVEHLLCSSDCTGQWCGRFLPFLADVLVLYEKVSGVLLPLEEYPLSHILNY